MQRDKSLLKRRKNFVKLANENPKDAAKILKSLARSLENCKTTSDTVYACSEIFCTSTTTIERDLYD